MPITDKGYEYQMPDGIRNQLTKELLVALHENIKRIFKVGEEAATNIGFYVYIESTYGWDKAFKEACLKHNKEWLYEYSRHLEWYEHDIFSGDVGDIMVEFGVIQEGVDCEEIEMEKEIAHRLNSDNYFELPEGASLFDLARKK